MKIAALEYFIAKLIDSLGQAEQLAAVPRGFILSSVKEQNKGVLPIEITEAQDFDSDDLLVGLASHPVDISKLSQLAPSLVLTSIPGKEKESPLSVISDWNNKFGLPDNCKVVSYNPQSLDQIFEMIEDIGARLKIASEAKIYAQKIKAQIMNWSDNFYDRCKRKKVVFIKSIEPLTVAGEWLADMINTTGAQSLVPPGIAARTYDWQEVLSFKPDVIMIAPMGVTQDLAFSSFKILEKLNDWESVPAVKRGEVYFSGGDTLFYQPGVNMIDSMAFIVSAIAGFESGYITKRNSFQRLRWLELQRHRF